jgi:hypothetical protein
MVSMTKIQQVLFELKAPYYGHPYYVTGNALFSGLRRRLDNRAQQALHVSNGVFLPGEYGSFSPEHSQSGGVPYMGTGLQKVEAYEDLFLFRDEAHRWLLDSRPRDAHNTPAVQSHGGRLTFASSTRFGRPPESRNSKRTMRWYVQCYLHAHGSDEDVIPLSDAVLDGVRVGGGRNYGLGEVSLKETQVVDLDALDYSRVRDADNLQLELLSPYVLQSEYPGADSQSVPWWWEFDGRLRRRVARIAASDEMHEVATIDHGQVVEYTGDRPVETAKKGVLRVGTHGKVGFGEFRLRPSDSDRVPERKTEDTSETKPQTDRCQPAGRGLEGDYLGDSGADRGGGR